MCRHGHDSYTYKTVDSTYLHVKMKKTNSSQSESLQKYPNYNIWYKYQPSVDNKLVHSKVLMSEIGHKLMVLHSDANFWCSHKFLQLWCTIKVIHPRPQYWFSSQKTECYVSLWVMGIISISKIESSTTKYKNTTGILQVDYKMIIQFTKRQLIDIHMSIDWSVPKVR